MHIYIYMYVCIYTHTHIPPDEIPKLVGFFWFLFLLTRRADFRASFWGRSAGIAGMSRMSRMTGMSCDDGIFHVKSRLGNGRFSGGKSDLNGKIPGKWRVKLETSRHISSKSRFA